MIDLERDSAPERMIGQSTDWLSASCGYTADLELYCFSERNALASSDTSPCIALLSYTFDWMRLLIISSPSLASFRIWLIRVVVM